MGLYFIFNKTYAIAISCQNGIGVKTDLLKARGTDKNCGF